MTLAAGTKLGPYEILSAIGAGGMGEVYRARDSRLGREMAIKVLPEGFASDPERLRRFENEARAASAISDPHIVSVFDVGIDDGRSFIATELVTGSDLRALLGKPVPVRKALDLAEQIAAGIAAAHERGIIHRDLKPENILVTKSGLAKIADFGLAKLAEIPDADRSGMPTVSRVETVEGIVMGTVAYMSPEQAAGRRVDHRSDQFALGVILYEMLTGIAFFRRETATETLAAILRDDPDPVAQVNPSVPPPLSWIVERCLAKDPDDRYASSRDLARDLSSAKARLSEAYATPAPGSRRMRFGEGAAWAIAAVLAVGLASVLLFPRRLANTTGPMRSSIVLSDDSALRAVAVSPDGTTIAFVARDSSGRSLLALRPLDSLSVRTLPGTENSSSPFWSPDGRFIGFFADGKLKRIEAAGGPPQIIVDAPLGRGGTWNRDGVILFSPVVNGPLYRISSSGGPSTPATRFDPTRGETSHRWPFFLPDGKHFVYDVASFGSGAKTEKLGIYAGALDSSEERFLTNANSAVAFVPSSPGGSVGFLLFMRGRDLYAQPFDASAIRLTGEPRSIAEAVDYFPQTHGGVYSASGNGLLVYRSRSMPSLSQLTWFDRSGRKLGLLGSPGNQANPRISPDGKRIALDIVDPTTSNMDVWSFDGTGGLPSRLTSDPGLDSTPVWSPNGTRIAFMSLRKNHPDIYGKNASGSGEDESLLVSTDTKFPTDWSPDGRSILCTSIGERTNFELWMLPAEGDRRPIPFLRAAYGVSHGQFSPDGKWVAYASNESGHWEIVVAPYPGSGRNWRVSTAGGTEPRWRRDGRELFYLAPDGKLMAVGVKEGPDFEANAAQPLFEIRRPDLISSTDFYSYDVSPDGERFIVNMVEAETSPPSLTLVVNWMAGVRP